MDDRGRKIKLSVLLPFHTDADLHFAISTVHPFNCNSVEKRKVKALNMSFFSIINFSDFLSNSHRVVLRFWDGSKEVLL